MDTGSTNPGMTTPEGRNLTAKTLIGDTVQNSQNENLGSVQDLMIDLQGGRIAYVVISHGGVLGIGDKLFAVPWNAFSLDAEGRNLLLEVDKDKLKNAEGFDKNSWPNTADRTWGQQVHDYYGTQAYWTDDR